MITTTSEVTARYEFLAVVLADPELLDMAFAEVIAAWEAEPPWPPDRTLVATSEGRHPQSKPWWAAIDRRWWSGWLRSIARPRVARSPPERSVAGRSCGRIDTKTNPQHSPTVPNGTAKEVVTSSTNKV